MKILKTVVCFAFLFGLGCKVKIHVLLSRVETVSNDSVTNQKCVYKFSIESAPSKAAGFSYIIKKFFFLQ